MLVVFFVTVHARAAGSLIGGWVILAVSVGAATIAIVCPPSEP